RPSPDRDTSSSSRKCELNDYRPLDFQSAPSKSFVNYLCSPATASQEIAFVDLESTTAGDDWSLLNRILAALEPPDAAAARHLLVIDAVEGLEMLVGSRDVFGLARSRRSRIAQLVRTAATKAHIVFVVEQRSQGERL